MTNKLTITVEGEVDPANRELNRVQVVPLTSRAGRLYSSKPSQIE